MATSNEEKYLKSIDGTLKDILKELKKGSITQVSNDVKGYNEKDYLSRLKKERSVRL